MIASLPLIASLPMYDWPELIKAHDRFWQGLAQTLKQRGIKAPAELSRDGDGEDETYWLSKNLLLGQTCGYPFSTTLKDKVTYVATPVYAVKGCSGPYYSSAIIAKTEKSAGLKSMTGARFAYNSTCSLSGYRAIKAIIGPPDDFFGQLIKSGGHRRSAKLVADNKADVAAIDAVCWHFLQKHDPAIAAQLKVIGWTEKYPALPLITARDTNQSVVENLRHALQELASTPSTAILCNNIAINGFDLVNAREYDRLAIL